MARATRASGPSYTEHELSDPDLPAVIIKRAEIGYVDQKTEEEEPSVGNSSTPSSKSESPSSDKQTANPPQRARTTANRSNRQARGTDSAAHSTDTGGQKATGKQSAKTTSIDDDDFFDE